MADTVSASRKARATAAAAAVFAVAFGYFALFVHYGFNLDDEGTLLAQFYRTYLGEIPYRDFHMGYTPAGHFFQARLFETFGVSVVPLRVALAVCHSLIAMLLFAIGRRIMTAPFATLAPLVYVAMLPFYPGEFASFNIPYPAWYVVLFWLAGLWTLLRFVETDHIGWVAESGVLAGLCFAFKPNVGLFQLAGSALVLLVALEPPEPPRASRFAGAVWWLLGVAVAGGLAFVFSSQASARDVRIFLWPIAVVLATLALRRVTGRSADAPPRGLFLSALILGVSMLAVVLPWTITFLRLLGTQRFARQILFIGTGFEQYYYVPFRFLTSWDAALALLAAVILVVGLLVRAGLMPPWLVVVGAVLGAVGVVWRASHAPMPEGAHAALVTRLEDLSFGATLIVHWAALLATVTALWRGHRSRRALEQTLILVSALTMYLQLYPRTDFTHLITAEPLTLVLAAALAAHVSRWFDVVTGWGRRVRAAVVIMVVAVALIRVAPNLAAVAQWKDGPKWRPHAALDLERAPVTLEMGRGARLSELNGVVRYLQANTAPGEAIFPFPAIELICFLADRPNATRHGYFFPGWPGHEVEAEVVSTLRAAAPRFVVALHAHQFFFINAPLYYYSLREFVDSRYRLVRSFGPYAVLARRDVDTTELHDVPFDETSASARLEQEYGDALAGSTDDRLTALQSLYADRLDFAWAPVVAELTDGDARVREAAVWALASAVGQPDVAAVYAQALLQGAVPDERRTLVLRRMWAFGDGRVIRPALELMHPPVDPPERSIALSLLEAVGQKLAIEDRWFGEPPNLRRVPDEAARLLRRRSWWLRLADPEEDPRLRHFLAFVLPRLGPVRGANEAIHQAIGTGASDLRLTAVAGVLRLGTHVDPKALMHTVLPLLGREPMWAPSLALDLYRRDPHGTRGQLLDALASPGQYDQLAVAWLMSATGDRHFRRPLLALLRSPIRPLRLAAVAGLERIGDPRTRHALEMAALDPDYEVREFAARALRAVPAS